MTAAVTNLALLSERRRRLLKSFRELNATSPQTAQRVQTLDSIDQQHFAELLQLGIIREAGPGRYYLDETTLQEYQAFWKWRGPTGIILIAATVVILAIIYALAGL